LKIEIIGLKLLKTAGGNMKKNIFLLLIGFCVFASIPVLANENDIKDFLDGVATEFERVDKIQDDAEKKEEIKKVANKIMDLPWIGKFVLGKYRRTLTEEQIDRFVDLYSQYMITTYLEILLVMKKDAYKLISIENQKEGVYFAKTLIKFDGKDVNNVFRIVKTKNDYLVTDMITEGVSFISTQRTDVISRIDTLGFDGFMREIKNTLKNKNAE
jgi:phospholipid transport system substrate-binding protein